MSKTRDSRFQVACLYRVSTLSQVDPDGDLSVQKNACREYARIQGNWDIVFEHDERGISAFRSSIASRPVLTQLMADAAQGKFEILLVFMFDRLARMQEEWAILSSWFSNCGVRVWSVHEGELTLDDLGAVATTAASTEQESVKTSCRVSAAHRQMVQQGRYRGGSAPYGYHVVQSKAISRSGDVLHDLQVDPESSKVVRVIFKLALSNGWGGNLIAKHLNAQGIPSPNGKTWHNGVVNYIINNPIYKGYMAYGKTKNTGESMSRTTHDEWVIAQESRQELAVVTEQEFDRLQEIRQRRKTYDHRGELEGTQIERTRIAVKEPLLLIGIIRCGHCGHALTTTYDYKSWTTKDGIVKKVQRAKYRCSGKGLAKSECQGQTMYSQQKIESAVVKGVSFLLSLLTPDGMRMHIDTLGDSLRATEHRLVTVEEALANNYRQLATRAGIGPAFVEEAIREQCEQVHGLRRILAEQSEETTALSLLRRQLSTWDLEFTDATSEAKKRMLFRVIERVTVHQDRVDITAHKYLQPLLLTGEIQWSVAF